MSTRALTPMSTALDSYLSTPQVPYQSLPSQLQETNQVIENGSNAGELQKQIHAISSMPPIPPSLRLEPSAMSTGESLEEVLANWSGRGTHVDFRKDEVVPLDQGRFLGHGSMGSVFETTVRGHVFAWKKRFCRRKIDVAEMKEIEILKKLSHHHIIKIAGSYTHRQFLGLLLYPVATCDLATFFEDAEALFNNDAWEPIQEERFEALGLYRVRGDIRYVIDLNTCVFISSLMGCIISAVEYLHGQKVRHKDLKPSNILLGAQGLWLTDFGTATDFSNQTVSTTDNCERGTPKYFSPEMAAFDKCGRSADIFSLGCVLLEMYTLKQGQTLEILRKLRPRHDKSYHSNLEGIHQWLSRSTGQDDPNDYQIKNQIQHMLKREPADRPTINKIQTTFALVDTFRQQSSTWPLFKKCCRGLFLSRDDHEREMNIARRNVAEKVRITMQEDIDRLRKENDHLLAHIDELQGKVYQQVQNPNERIQRNACRLNNSDASLDDFATSTRSTGPEPKMIRSKPGYTATDEDGELWFSMPSSGSRSKEQTPYQSMNTRQSHNTQKLSKNNILGPWLEKRIIRSSAKQILGLARNNTKTTGQKKNSNSSVSVVASEVRDTVLPIRSVLKDPDAFSDDVSSDSADQSKIESSRQFGQYPADNSMGHYFCLKCGLEGDSSWLRQHNTICEKQTAPTTNIWETLIPINQHPPPLLTSDPTGLPNMTCLTCKRFFRAGAGHKDHEKECISPGYNFH